MHQIALLAGLILTGHATAHPFHVSFAVADWRPKTNALEVSLRCHPVDLQQALRDKSKRPVDLDKSKNVGKLAQE